MSDDENASASEEADLEEEEKSKDDRSQFEDEQAEPKYSKGQKVYARDKDGVLYESVVRRRLFGLNRHRQVQLGLVDDVDEADAILAGEEKPCWHYFMHYQKWNVNWDRWVQESDVFEMNEEMKAYAAKLLTEMAALKKSLSKKSKGKKAFQTIDGVSFLRAWTIRRSEIDREMKLGKIESREDEKGEKKPDVVPTATVTEAKKNVWGREALEKEISLRSQSLTQKRPASVGNSLSLGATLKKNLVEQWEIISQCKMVPQLPAPTTVRQLLTQYLASKDIEFPDERNKQDYSGGADKAIVTDGASGEECTPEVSEEEQRRAEWIKMAEGLMICFDEALSTRLLYRQELPQARLMDRTPEYTDVRDVDVYGCEHMLRLLVRLPELINDEYDDMEARPILAKVNDFARFMNKNHSTLLTQNYRRLNEEEEKELSKLDKRTADRKRKVEEVLTPVKKLKSEA